MRFLRDAGWIEREDAYLTRRFRAAGLVSLGRTNTPELALLPTTEPEAYGATRNPWNPAHSAGGSSGGSAAAVAAGIVPAAHASDGGGSIRGPASMCGLVGLKPTRGRNSFGPALGERWSGFSVEFVVTRSVRDAAALLDVTAGAMPGDPYAAPPPPAPVRVGAATPPAPLRIGVLRGAPRSVERIAECVAAVDRAARLLAGLGHRVEEAHPEALDEPEHVMTYVAIVVRQHRACPRGVGDSGSAAEPGEDDIEPLTWALAERGRAATAAELLAAIESVHAFGRRLAAWWDERLRPAPHADAGRRRRRSSATSSSTPEEPLRAFMRAAPYGACTLPFNMSGQPAISLPLHWTPDGLPIGVQLVAAFGREDLLLAVAAQLEQAAPWAGRRPPLHA